MKMSTAAGLLLVACCLLCMPRINGSTTVSTEPPAKQLFGGWKPIDDVNEPHVKETGAFAVSEHNKRRSGSEKQLLFRRVVVGEQQVVAGINYRLVVEVEQQRPALRSGLVVKYEAVVYEKPWENYRNLASFKPKN